MNEMMNIDILSAEQISNVIKIITNPQLVNLFSPKQIDIMKAALVSSIDYETTKVVRSQYKAGNINLDVDNELGFDILR